MDISALLTHNAKQDEPPTSPASSEDVTAQIERMTPIAVDEAMVNDVKFSRDRTVADIKVLLVRSTETAIRAG